MLTIEALNQITATHAAAAGRELETDTPAMLVPDGYAIQKTEHLQEGRSRFRGRLSTNSMPEFCGYVSRRAANVDIAAFIDADDMSCQAFFNLGSELNPGHADDIAVVKLKPTAGYKAVTNIAGAGLTQAELAEWMEDWAAGLKVVGAQGEDIPVGVAVQKIRTITIKAASERTSSETSFSAGRSLADSIEAAHAEQQPADLLFTCAPYEGLGIQTFTLRLSILTGSEKPKLKARWVQEEAQVEAMAQEFKRKLTTEIGGLAVLTLGTFNPGN